MILVTVVGQTVFDIIYTNGTWQQKGNFHHIDFKNIGHTYRNCGGSLTPNNTIFSCEESAYLNTDSYHHNNKGIRDTSARNNRPMWKNFGYVVEVDPFNKKALRTLIKMGRFAHEDALCTSDGNTVFLTDDYCPGVFYKLETKTPFDYSEGQLYAYQQSVNGLSGNWLKLQMDTTSLVFARQTAIAHGASMFIRHEWIEMINDKLSINETGTDQFDWTLHMKSGGTVPTYITKNLDTSDYTFEDVYGRILEFDPKTNKMNPYL